MAEKKYYYSEIFHSIQGEGHYTGVPTAWIRFFLCNLQCSGFGQIDPTNPDTWIFGIPSIWAWQILFWIIGVYMMWMLAYKMEFSTPSKKDL